MNSGQQYLKAKPVEESTRLEGCQVSCMIQIGDKLVIADNQTSQPEVKLFGAQCKQLDKLTLDKSRIKDLTSTKNNTFAALKVVSHWIFPNEYYIVLMEVTHEEKLTELNNKQKFKFEITALHFANNLYFLASRDPKPCIKLYNMRQKEVVYTIASKSLFHGNLSKIHVDDNYRMIVSDSTNKKIVIFDYAPATHEVTNAKVQKFKAFHIEPIPDGTILLATAANTSIVRLFPNAQSADNDFIETGRYPCGMAYNNVTGKLRIVVEKKKTLHRIFNKNYKVLTYQCELCTDTDTIIDM